MIILRFFELSLEVLDSLLVLLVLLLLDEA